MNLETIRDSLVDEIRSKGKPGGHEKLQAYLGVNCKVLGLSTPQLRDILARFVRSHKDLTRRELNLLAGTVWAGSSVGEKWSAISLLNRFSGLTDDESWRMVDGWTSLWAGGFATARLRARLRNGP
jgi:DNA alkylation repair enzyme